MIRLHINIDHVATIRNARGTVYPDPVTAAALCELAGADGITAHLREDRRHISDDDIARLKAELTRPLNLEMAATDEMLDIALRHQPNACCLVPERREERTTEGGLNVAGGGARLQGVVGALKDRSLVRVQLEGTRVVWQERLLGDLRERIRDVRNGPDGALWLLTDSNDGRVLRVTPANQRGSQK